MLSAAAHERPRAPWAWWMLAAVAIVAGVWLRLYQLHSQLLLDDEWHAVRMLLRSDAWGIFTHFGAADHCIPLTLYYRWLYDHGALSEWQMHLPLLIAGLALMIVPPLMMRRRVSLPVRAAWTALLAISPLLVYFSRTARPYAFACLAAFVAIVAFHAWWRGGRARGWAVTYVVATAAAAWLHLLSIVFTLWPFVYFGLPALRDALRRRDARAFAAMIVLAFATVAALAILLLPPLVSDFHAMATKAGHDTVTLVTLYRALAMISGLAHPLLVIVPLALIAIGVRQSWRNDADFAGYVASMIVIGAGVVAVARPAWVQHQLTFVRYTLPILPFMLLFMAEGLVFVVSRLRIEVLAAGAAAAFMVALVAAGPFPREYHFPNQFMDHALYQFDYDASTNPFSTLLVLGPMPEFYRDLARRPPGSVTLIEGPGRLVSNYVPDPWYQAIHRQNVKYLEAAPACGGEADEYPYTAGGTRFRGIAKLADLLDGATWGADYLVLRLQPWSVPPGIENPWPDMSACAAKVESRLGAPVFRDARIAVFALHPAH